jgi:drug/metabolite transporter (DMT)-like permease
VASQHPQPDQKKAMLLGLATVAMWSTVATAFKLALARLDPPQLVLYASLTSCLVLLVVLAARRGLWRLVAMTGRQWLRAALLGALNPFLYYGILFQAYALLPAQEAQAINYTWAITLSLLAVPLLGQRLSGRDGLAIAGGYLGVVVIATRGRLTALSFDSPLGVALALASTLIWALYWILGAKDDRDPVAGLLANFLCSLPPTLVYVLFVSDPLPASPSGLLAAAYVGVFEMGLAFVTWLTALRLATNATRVANLVFLSPLVSLVLIHFVVGETIAPATIVGLACILAGLALQRAKGR